jgi:exosortase/archaeosortase family protein
MLFGLIYFEDFSPFIFINNLQTDLSVFLTQKFIDFSLLPVNMIGNSISFNHDLELKIVNECNGLAGVLLLLGAFLSYPTLLRTKINWIFFSYLFLVIVNSIRLNWIIYYMIEHPENFVFIHDIVSRYFFAIVVLLLFYFFVKKSKTCEAITFLNNSCK